MAVRGDPHFEPLRARTGVRIRHVQAPGAPAPGTVMTMRRFFARSAGVSFGATGCVSPNPLADPRPDPEMIGRNGIFRDHNCSCCKDGKRTCVSGNPRNCSFLHARND
jgi:hypothetical protein